MIKKTRVVKTYTVTDNDGNHIGIWHNTSELMHDLKITSQTYISDSIRDGIYIRPYRKSLKKYLITMERKVETYYIEGNVAPKKYVPLPDTAKESPHTPGLYLTPMGRVFGSDEVGYCEIFPYINKYKGAKTGYYTFMYNDKVLRLHVELGYTFIDGYQDGYVIYHVDGNSLNNKLTNLKWISRADRMSHHWDKITPEKREEYKQKYKEGVAKAHKDGKYKDHYAAMKTIMKNKSSN